MAGAAANELAARAAQPASLTPILGAALDAFFENGHHGASAREIAGRVCATVPALYYHHRNKEDAVRPAGRQHLPSR